MRESGEMWRTVRWLVTLVAILGGLHFLVVGPLERSLSTAREDTGKLLREALRAVTGTDTRVVEGRAEIVRSAEISELSLLEMRMNTTRTIEKSESFAGLPLGTKKLIFRGHYQVKGGYRLTDGISLRMEERQAVARFPQAEILSVELLDVDFLSEDSGWLNRIQPADRAQILRELREQMRAEAERAGMLETVEANLRTRLRDLLGAESVTLERALP